MNAKKMMWFCLALTVVCPSFVHATFPFDLLYVNDFQTRRSQTSVPSGEWMTTSYIADTSLYNNFDQNGATIQTPYRNKDKIQNGWTKGFNGAGLPGYVRTNAEGNALAFLSHETIAGQHGIARHSLYNDFTNGTVVLEADLRPPSVWAGSSRVMAIYLGDDVFNSPYPEDSQTFYKYIVGSMGFTATKAGEDTNGSSLIITGGTDARDGTSKAQNGAVVDTSHWYRFSGRFDLDTGTFTATVYDMGTSQPTLNTTPPATAFATFTDIPFRRDIAHGLNGASSIGIGAYGTKGTWSANPENGAAFDNLRVAWRTPGSETDEDCYLNDFSVCRQRILTMRSTEYEYSLATGLVTNSFTEYIVNSVSDESAPLFPNGDGNKNQLPPIGVDAWRRVNCDGHGIFSVTKLNNNNVLRVSAFKDNPLTFGIASHPIGITVSNGHVRIRADVRTPDKWYWNDYHNIRIALGDDLYYGGLHSEFGNHQHILLGITSAESKMTDFNPCIIGKETKNDTTTHLTSNTWYRIAADLDLDAWTCDYALYDMGMNTPTFSQSAGELLYQATGIEMKTNQTVRTVSSFGLMSYGCGQLNVSNINSCVFFDNIEISAYASDPANARRLYSNSFSTRSIVQDRPEAPMVGEIDRVADSQDMWIRRNNGTANIRIVKPIGGRNRVEFSDIRGSTYAYASQLFPKTLRDGVFYLQTDIRPPSCWFWEKARGVTVYVGDSAFWQGNIYNDSFSKHMPFSFGFGNPNASNNSSVALTVECGDGEHYDGTAKNDFSEAVINSSHWYRFQMKANMRKETFSLTVFDMGTGQPSFDSEPLAEVAQFIDRPFTRHITKNGVPSPFDVDGLSSLSLCAFGVRGADLFPEPERVYFANLAYGYQPNGLTIILH